MHYVPPSPENLTALKTRLGRTGDGMAELAGLGGGHQWRKYTGGQNPRTLSAQMAFFMAAQLALTDDELERVYTTMQEELGARITP